MTTPLPHSKANIYPNSAMQSLPADQAYHLQEGKRSTSALDRVRSGAFNGHTLNLLLLCHLSIYNMLQIFAVPTVADNSVISLWAEIMSCFLMLRPVNIAWKKMWPWTSRRSQGSRERDM